MDSRKVGKMNQIIEILTDMLRVHETTRGDGLKSPGWFNGHKVALEGAIRTVRMHLRITESEAATTLINSPSKYQVLGNIEDVHNPGTRGFVDGDKLRPGDMVQLYKHGALFVDEQGCFTWLITKPPKMIEGKKVGTVEMTRLRLPVLSNLHKLIKG